MEVQKHKKWEWEREQGRDPKIKMVSQLFFDIPHFNSCEWCIFNVVEGLGQQGGAVVPPQCSPSSHRPQTWVWGDLLRVDYMVSGR